MNSNKMAVNRGPGKALRMTLIAKFEFDAPY